MTKWISDSDSGGEFDTSPLFGEVYNLLLDSCDDTEKHAEVLEAVDVGKLDSQVMWTVLDVYQDRSERIVRLWRGVGCPEYTVTLRGKWVTSKLGPGDLVFVIATWHERSAVIDNSGGYIVLFPHLSVAASRMSLCVRCTRSAYLSYLLPAGVANTDLIYGTVAHEVVQKVLDGCVVEDLVQVMDAVAESQMGSVTAAGVAQKEFREMLNQIVPIAQEIKGRMEVETVPNLKFDETSVPPYGCKVVAEEELLYSFQYGLTGRVDVTLSDGKLFPLEMKSGGCTIAGGHLSHVAQLNSYILMMKEKYRDLAHEFGVLYYMKTNTSVMVEPPLSQTQSLILMRNNLVYAHLHGEIPETVAVPSGCKNCESLNACAFLGKFDIEGNHIRDFLDQNVQMNVQRHRYQFYRDLDDELLDELMAQKIEQGCIWTAPPETRIARGIAVDNLTLELTKEAEFVFRSDKFSHSRFRLYSVFLLTKGGKLPIIGRGSVTKIKDNEVEVRFTELRVTLHEKNLFMDLFEYPTEVSIARGNLMLMFSYSSPRHSERMQRLIIDGDRPSFRAARYELLGSGLDPYQEKAIQSCLAVKDYLLIDGMARSGKTMVLVMLISCLVEMRKRILVIAPSSAGADYFCHNILGLVPFIRVSLTLGIHPELVPYTSAAILESVATQDEMLDVLSDHLVYVTTLSDYRHEMVMSHPFDVLVVDDASRIRIVDIIGPLSLSSKFIMTGDMTMSSDKSLFQRLGRSNPDSVCYLKGYYGYNKTIFKAMNGIFYRNQYHHIHKQQNNFIIPNQTLVDCFHQLHKSWISSAVFSDEITICDISHTPGSALPVAAALVTSLIIFGLEPTKIGIITFTKTDVKQILTSVMTDAYQYFPNELRDFRTISSLVEIHNITTLRDNLQYQMKQIDIGLVILTETDFDYRDVVEAIMTPAIRPIIITSKNIIQHNPIMMEIHKNSHTVLIPRAIIETSVKPFLQSFVISKDES